MDMALIQTPSGKFDIGLADDAMPVAQRKTYSLVGDGIAGVATVTDHAGLQLLGDQTIEFYFTAANGESGVIWDKGYGGEGTINRTGWGGGRLSFFTGPNGGNTAGFFNSQSFRVDFTNKTHCVLVRNMKERTVQWFFDGNAESLRSLPFSSIGLSNMNLRLLDGYQGAMSAEMSGIRYYNRALSASEVAQRAAGESVGRNGLVLDIPCAEGQGSVASDYSGYGAHAALSDGITWGDTVQVPQLASAAGPKRHLQADAGLRTAIILSLFIDETAKQGDILPDGGTNKRGFWAQPDLGSRLWLLDRSKQLDAVLQAAQDYAGEALLWLVDDGIAQSVVVRASWLRAGVLLLLVTIFKQDGSSSSYKFEQTWEQSL